MHCAYYYILHTAIILLTVSLLNLPAKVLLLTWRALTISDSAKKKELERQTDDSSATEQQQPNKAVQSAQANLTEHSSLQEADADQPGAASRSERPRKPTEKMHALKEDQAKKNEKKNCYPSMRNESYKYARQTSN